ncbi:MAG TPA: DNA repair protein RecN [Solirubrobacteraceae bacterium]|nr:DNA repair protein RecN [Solirubrobacteraceae bacterium]
MLYELRVENLLLMERAELRLVPGLNVLTGETGAGKTLLAHALDLLLGGKARSGIVRDGAAEAYVEGVFALPRGWSPDHPDGGGDERIPADAQELVLARRVWPDGRTRAYVCGRAATVADLRELGSRLLSFYGQHEHRKLMLTTAQLDALDAFCGEDQVGRRAAMAEAHERVRALEAELTELEALVGARERELDLLAYELREIEATAPSVEEERELTAERDRLRHQATLRQAARAGADAVAPEEGVGVGELLAGAAAELESVAGIDPALAPLAERLATLRYEAEDVAAELRSYLDGFDGEPGRLELVEERLGAFARLARKHGGGIADVLAHADACRARRDALQDADVTFESLSAELAAARATRERVGAELSQVRHEAAPRLAEAVLERLAELAMGDARFEVALRDRDGGYGPRGRDAVEFRIAPNPGLPFGPLREVASGGELSRVMLALLSVAHGGAPAAREGGEPEPPGRARGRAPGPAPGPAPGAAGAIGGDGDGSLLVFDEVDAGIGGHTARAVGAHLRELAEGRQILCITHLPQVAAMGNRHFTIVKDGSRSPALTTVAALEGDAVVGELVRMLGADEHDRAARGHARELLRAV